MERPELSKLCIRTIWVFVSLSWGCVELPSPLTPDFADSSVALDALTERLDDSMNADIIQPNDAAITSDVGDLVDGSVTSDIGEAYDVQLNPDVYVPGCGNGIIDPGEECDEGGVASGTCSEMCLAIECGNGRVDPGEACDDGNDDENDGCFDNCQVFFPDSYVTFYEDAFLETWTHDCAFDNGNRVNWNYEMGTILNRPAVVMWRQRHSFWLELGYELTAPTRFSLDFHMPDGKARKLKFGLATSVPQCGSSFEGAFIRHYDRKHTDSDPRVRVTFGMDPDISEIEMPGSGRPNEWINLKLDVHPPSGMVRFWYNDLRIGQARLPSGTDVVALRFIVQHQENESVGEPFSVANFSMSSVE